MKKNLFVIKSADNQTMAPVEYGYWSVQWAFDIALGEIKSLSDPKYNGMETVKKIAERPFPALFQLAALYTGAYWFYSWGVLWETPTYIVPAIKRGSTDGIKEYVSRLDSVSEPAASEMVGVFESLCCFYLEAHGKDYAELSKREPGIYPDPSSAAKKFLEMISKVYLEDNQLPNAAEQYLLSFLLIDDSIESFYATQKNEIGIEFI